MIAGRKVSAIDPTEKLLLKKQSKVIMAYEQEYCAKTIWASLAPLLEEAGFLIVGDTGRRFSSPQIAVVGLQWFGAALAKRFGAR